MKSKHPVRAPPRRAAATDVAWFDAGCVVDNETLCNRQRVSSDIRRNPSGRRGPGRESPSPGPASLFVVRTGRRRAGRMKHSPLAMWLAPERERPRCRPKGRSGEEAAPPGLVGLVALLEATSTSSTRSESGTLPRAVSSPYEGLIRLLAKVGARSGVVHQPTSRSLPRR